MLAGHKDTGHSITEDLKNALPKCVLFNYKPGILEGFRASLSLLDLDRTYDTRNAADGVRTANVRTIKKRTWNFCVRARLLLLVV
jgi:hypothetical protein